MTEVLFEQALPKGRFIVYSDPPYYPVKYLQQVHGEKVVDANLLNTQQHPKADGLWIEQGHKHPIAVLTADCLPIVVLGTYGQALLHAGWRGVKTQIYTSLEVQALEPYYFFIGPSIQVQTFEVQEDFYTHFPDSDQFKQIGDKYYFDLQAQVITDLQRFFSSVKIDNCAICSFSDHSFHSYRRNATTLRNWNVYLPSGA